jgi:hypothetical protein
MPVLARLEGAVEEAVHVGVSEVHMVRTPHAAAQQVPGVSAGFLRRTRGSNHLLTTAIAAKAAIAMAAIRGTIGRCLSLWSS